MTTERKAFRALFRMISDGQITEKEAFDLAEAVFAISIQYVPVPSSVTEEPTINIEATPPSVEVKGFLPNNE